jgi:hypothetical protein
VNVNPNAFQQDADSRTDWKIAMEHMALEQLSSFANRITWEVVAVLIIDLLRGIVKNLKK